MKKVESQQWRDFTIEELETQVKKTKNWKSPGFDCVHNYWLKSLKTLWPILTKVINKMMKNPETIPEWITKGKTTLIFKKGNENEAKNYRPITCLPTMYKLNTLLITERVYAHVTDNNILPYEQKGCMRNARGCKEQLLLDKNIMEIVKRRKRNISIMWIDYKKAYDSVPHEWIKEILTMYKIDPITNAFISHTMKSWRLLLTLPNEKEEIKLEECKIKRGIFQGDSFSPLVFCLAMAPLSRILKRAKVGFKINNELISHLKYIDDLKVYAKNKDEMKRCINLVEMFSRDIKMELGLDKCAIINVVKGEVNNKDFETKIPILTGDDEYRYLGIAETSDILHNKMKEIEVKEFFKRVRAIGKAKLNAMNFTRAFNSFAVPVIRYGFGILNWTKTELQQLDRKTSRSGMV